MLILAIITPVRPPHRPPIGHLYASRHRPVLQAMNTLTVDLLSPMLIASLVFIPLGLWMALA